MTLTAHEINDLYKEYHVPQKVVKHMLKVAQFAGKLCDKFAKKGIKVDKDSVVKAALLHDLTRVADFNELKLKSLKQKVTSADLGKWIALRDEYSSSGHEKSAAKILRNLGGGGAEYKKIATLIEQHDFFAIDSLKTWEEKILYYSDKRVEGARVVRLKTRFRKSRKRNLRPSDDIKKIQEIEQKVFALEKAIKAALRRAAIKAAL